MLVTGKQILDHANENGYAVGAFNFSNMEILHAIIDAAEQQNSPVIVQTSEGAISYAGHGCLAAMAHEAASKAKVPVALHLDHGTTYDTIIKCVSNGWTSIMIDGSHHNFEDNVSATKEVVTICHAADISVEAELGRLSGIEDNISVSEKDAIYTNPDEAVKFVEQSGVDYLAIAIGTAHGKYKGTPKLDFERLDKIKKLLPNTPIVLHGSSGIPEEDIKKAVSLGVNKINIDTDIRLAFTDAVKKVTTEKPDEFDPRKIVGPAKKAMTEVVAEKIRMFGSANKA